MSLTDRFADALVFAEKLHRAQTRKGNDIPYIAHLMAIAATALEWGGDEDVAIAALLHDAVEDQGGMETADLIRARYGQRVAVIVLACSDSLSSDAKDKAPWEERKRRHIAHLADASPEVALVTAADKLHNLTAMLRDVRREGPSTLARFNAPDRQVWYFTAIAEALAPHAEIAPVAELRAGARELEGLLAKAAA
ncbi:MAG: HD domain-containing protein [Caulobacteraceae bacterium]